MSTLPAAGSSITFRKTMTVAEQGFFTGITGNMTRTHVDRAHATDAGLSDMSVFELAASGLLTTALGRLAGPTWRIGDFSVSFARAFPVGSSIAATATVTAADDSAIACDLVVTLGDETVISGTARMVPLRG